MSENKDNPIKKHMKSEVAKLDKKHQEKKDKENQKKLGGQDQKVTKDKTRSKSVKAKVYGSITNPSRTHDSIMGQGIKTKKNLKVFDAISQSATSARYQNSKLKKNFNKEVTEADKKVRWGKVAHDVAVPTRFAAAGAKAASAQLKKQEAGLKLDRERLDDNTKLNKVEKGAIKSAAYAAQAPITATRKTLNVAEAISHTPEAISQPLATEAKKLGKSMKQHMKNSKEPSKTNSSPDQTPAKATSGKKQSQGQAR